jgi:hypothetical protein
MLKANKISVGKGYYNNSKIIEISLIILLFVFGISITLIASITSLSPLFIFYFLKRIVASGSYNYMNGS